MDRVDVLMPQLGESVVEGTLVRWLVRPGDHVRRDQPVAAISTDKADAEIVAPADGVLAELLAPEGQVVPVGHVVARLEPGAPVAEGAAEVSPVVRRLARRLHVDIDRLEGTGLEGRVTRDDVLRAGEPAAPRAHREPPSERPVAAPRPGPRPRPAPPQPVVPEAAPDRHGYRPAPEDRVIPLSPRRRAIAEHMIRSLHVAAQVTAVAEVDLDRVARLRAAPGEGERPSFIAFVADAAARALREHPRMNAVFLADAIVERRAIHLGIAVETEGGLVVPVIRDADALSLRGLSRAIADLAARARAGRLAPDDVAGASFTISNPGRHGNLFGTPILHLPQVGLLRMGEVIRRPVVVDRDGDDAIVIHPVLHLALTYDHRAVDGAPANAFLHRVRELLERGEFEL